MIADEAGRLAITGWRKDAGGKEDLFVARLEPDGSPTTAFDGDGIRTIDRAGGLKNDRGIDIAWRPGGGVVVLAQVATNPDTNVNNYIAALHALTPTRRRRSRRSPTTATWSSRWGSPTRSRAACSHTAGACGRPAAPRSGPTRTPSWRAWRPTAAGSRRAASTCAAPRSPPTRPWSAAAATSTCCRAPARRSSSSARPPTTRARSGRRPRSTTSTATSRRPASATS